jgi:hypothetical protein
MNDLIGTGTILLALLALAGGILAARSVHPTSDEIVPSRSRRFYVLLSDMGCLGNVRARMEISSDHRIISGNRLIHVSANFGHFGDAKFPQEDRWNEIEASLSTW